MKVHNTWTGLRPIDVISRSRWITVCAVVCAMAATLFSQTAPRSNRITQQVTSGAIVTLSGSVHPLTRRATDLGSANSDMAMDSMSLDIGLSAAQQTELNALMEAQQNPKSPQYHQWLTQEQYGARFGLTESDLNKIIGWLQGQGFSVKRVSTSRNTIYFSGKAWQAESAFHTQLHLYKLDGDTHFANATELRLPAALAAVVTHVGGLTSFRPKPRMVVQKANPNFTSYISGNHFLTPGDWATIYDVTPIYNAGYTGTGMHIGVAGQTYFDQSDIDSFRSAAGLSATRLNMACISSANCTGTAGESLNDIPEADLDVEWSGGIAQNATVDFIYASGSDPNLGVFDALVYGITTYQVSGNVVPVLSISYAACEADVGESLATAEETYFEQATTQGQTILNSSGDQGAAACDYDVSVSTQGAAVNWPASSPHVTGVGGTTFSGDGNDTGADAFWSYSSTADIISSALQYIPETSWNDTAADGTLSSSGGGVSQIYALPTWQWAPSNYSGTNLRFVPDVAFSASADHDGYLVCSGDNCVNGFRDTDGSLTPYGGTSASTPSFAGMLTLLVQKYGNLGNINPTLYGLAKTPATYASVFHDITTGTNKQPCTTGTGCTGGYVGYAATTGYDLVTGLGSVDGGALEAALAPTPPATTTTAVSASPSELTIGGTTTLMASVTSTTPGTITGMVAFTVTEGSSTTTVGAAAISGGTATLSNVAASVADGFSAGSGSITASYGGDANFAASSGSTPMIVSAMPTTTTVTATPNSVALNGTTTLSATVTPTSATGTVTFRLGSTTLGTAPVSGGTATLVEAITAANGFSTGSGTITASYSGDANDASSTSTTPLAVTAAQTPTTSVTVSATPSSVMVGGVANLIASVSSTTAGTVSGTVTFAVGSTTLGTAAVSNGTAALSVTVWDSATGFGTGLNTVTATYSGNATYAGSKGSGTLTVTAAPTTITVTAAPNSVALGGTTELTATVTSSIRGNMTGSVTFLVNSTPVGTATFSSMGQSSSGDSYAAILPSVAVNSANGFTAGSDSITVSYSGDINYAGSNGSGTLAVTAAPPSTASSYTLVASSTALTGSSAVTLLLTSTNYAGTVALTPAVTSTNGTASNVTANLSPTSVTLTSNGNSTSTLTISANSSAAKRAPVAPWSSGGSIVLGAVLLGAPFSLRKKRVLAVLLMALTISAAGFLMSCGGSGSSSSTTPAPRIYTVTVTPQGSGTVTNPSPVSVTLTVQ